MSENKKRNESFNGVMAEMLERLPQRPKSPSSPKPEVNSKPETTSEALVAQQTSTPKLQKKIPPNKPIRTGSQRSHYSGSNQNSRSASPSLGTFSRPQYVIIFIQ